MEKGKKNHDKETPEFFEGAPKENFWSYQRKPKHWSKPVTFNDKVINAQPLVQPHGATHYCC